VSGETGSTAVQRSEQGREPGETQRPEGIVSGAAPHDTGGHPGRQTSGFMHSAGVPEGEPVGSVAAGPHGSHVQASGGFSPSQLSRIDEALTFASNETGLTFSLYVGHLADPTRGAAEGLFDQIVGQLEGPVLVAVSPGQRVLHIVTGEASAPRLPNRACALAALAMRAAFSSGDLTGGIVTGLRMLADAAGRRPR
jgi:hypothetical protein